MSDSASGRLRVLVVAGREPWPLNSGGRLRLYNFLCELARVARVTLAVAEPAAGAQHLPAGVNTVMMHATARTVAPRLPWVVQRAVRHFGTRPAVRAWLARFARPANFDVTLLYGAVNGQYVDAVRTPVVWDAVDDLVLYTLRDAGWRGATSWPGKARAAALYIAYERHVTRRAVASVFASPLDASLARRWAGPARITAISNGVDFDYFHPVPHAGEPGTIAFVGSLSFPPNVEAITRFVARVWPAVHAGPHCKRLLIVGREPAEVVRRLATGPDVELHADVPDVRPYLARAAAVVVPTQLGGGVKNKVLEACAMRRPVVASPRALAGLSARRGIDVLCAASEAAWVHNLWRLLQDRECAQRVAENGHAWVRSAHPWSAMARQLVTVLCSAACTRPADGGFEHRDEARSIPASPASPVGLSVRVAS